MRSSVEVYDLAASQSRVVWQTDDLVEAPNFTPDGEHLLINGGGRLYRLPLTGGTPQMVDTGFAHLCNNDHGFSPHGRWLAVTDKTEFGKSAIYILPSQGGTPRLVTPDLPSYWHGWSPDGARICYCGIRDNIFDIYTNSVEGGDERRLTAGEGRNDGPDYSADGQWIYFNSSRTGHMQIWRVRPDGTDPQRVTHDDRGNWFPHPAPDNDKVLFLSYAAGVFDHPRDHPVELRLMDMDGCNARTLFSLFGGQGTINVPCWSADGRTFAYVRYAPA